MKLPALTPYKIDPERAADFYQILSSERLKDAALTPRHKTQSQSIGFRPLDSEDGMTFLQEIGPLRRFSIGIESAIYTPKSINLACDRAEADFLDKHAIEEIPEETRWQIFDQVRIDIIANAPSEINAWWGWIDTENHWLFIGAAGSQADKLTDELRGALGTLPIALIKTQKSPSAVLTRWIQHGGHSDQTYTDSEGNDCHTITIDDKLNFEGLHDPGQPKTKISMTGEFNPELIENILGRSFTLKSAQLSVLELSTFKINDKWHLSGYEFNKGAYVDQILMNDPEADLTLDFDATLLMTADHLQKSLMALIDACEGLETLSFAPDKPKEDENQATLDLNDAETLLSSITEAAESIVNASKLNALAYKLDDDGTPILDLDPLTAETRIILAQHQKCSISAIQRRLRIGYNRAARLVEFAEAVGWVSIPDHQGRRVVKLPHPDASKNLDDIKPSQPTE